LLQTRDGKGYEVDFPTKSLGEGQHVAKDKKKDKKSAKKNKKDKKNSDIAGLLSTKPAKAASRKLKDWSQNPLVADVVAAALVATASALKDSRTAKRLAAEAGDEIEKLTKKGAERGNALWQMALEIGRRSLEEISDSAGNKTRRK
jgi:hypothetical protein